MSHGGRDPSIPAATSAPVRVEIGVLSLGGLSRAHGGAIAAALRLELGRLLQDPATQRRLREVATRGAVRAIDAGRMRFVPTDRAERLGARIAECVARGLLDTARIRSGR